MACSGELNFTGLLLKNIFPSYPPVEKISGMPNKIFNSVDFPAPFSPIKPNISPEFSENEISQST